MKLYWNPETTLPECSLLLVELGQEYPIFSGPAPAEAKRGSGGCKSQEDQLSDPSARPHTGGTPMLPELTEGLRVDLRAGYAGVEVGRESGGFVVRCGSLCGLGRGLGTVLSGVLSEVEEVKEALPFDRFGVMLDVSRNAVMRPEHLRRWMRRLCLFGFNRLMLYMEDTYQLPEEPYFGYLRGGYSSGELRRISGWGEVLGIEVGGCIQTLGHLEQVLKWPDYNAVRDTTSVLRVDEEATYALIGKMFSEMGETLPCRTLHVGFDEAHDLGRGMFLDRHGYQLPFEIYVRHLQRVCEICARHGLKPQIWSDMVFRLGSATGDYYDRSSVVPPGVIESLPAGVGMVYWDYYGLEEEHYRYWLNRHNEARFEAACGMPYAHAVLPCEMEVARPGTGIPLDQNGYLSDGIGPVLWDDPLLGIIRKNRQEPGYWKAFERHQEMVFEKLDALPAHEGMIDTGHARNIAEVLRRKVRLANVMESAYRSNDRSALRAAANEIPDVIAAIRNLQASFRKQWLRRNRPNGLETIQIRLAGLAERYQELARRLEELPLEMRDAIPEWDESPGVPARGLVQWRRIASPGIL